MKLHLSCVILIITINIFASSLAYPHALGQPSSEENVIYRSRRSLTGAFDSFMSGVDALYESTKKVGRSAMKAVESVFTDDTWNSLTSGFSKFKKGFKDAVTNIFGENGSIKKGWDKFTGVFKGDEKDPKQEYEVLPEKKSWSGEKEYAPTGSVPKGETT